jgi:hypothetical protein
VPPKNTKNLPKQSPAEKRKVIIELHPTPALVTAMARNAGNRRREQFGPATLFPGIDIDSSFPPTRVPAEHDTRTPDPTTEQPELPVPKPPRPGRPDFNYITRAEVDDEELPHNSWTTLPTAVSRFDRSARQRFCKQGIFCNWLVY